jgi:Tfp pilus assembly protein PilV
VTLLEALVALVVLGVGATGFLGLFQQSAHAARNAAEWTRTVAYAESGMEAATIGVAPLDTLPGWTRAVDTRPWPGRAGLTEIDVTVVSPRGVRFTLRSVVDRSGASLGTAGAAR